MQLLKEWPWHHKFGNSLMLAWFSLTFVSHIPYYVIFRFNNGPNMSSVLACFPRQFGRYTWKVFFSAKIFFCYVSERCVKDFYGSNRINEFLTLLYSVSYKSNASKFWQSVCKLISIRLISFNNLMKIEGRKIYAIKTNNFESAIIRVRDFYF